MKTNQLRYNGISILFSLTAVLLFPLISNAQVKVLSGGSVGIGTTSPHSTIQAVPISVLDLKGTGRTSYVLHGGSSGQETCLVTSGIGTYFDIAGHSTASNNFFSFRTSNTAGSFSVGEKMRITSAGNVGIGTSTPLTKLDVAGVARLTSSAADLYLTSTGAGAGTWRILGSTNTTKLFRIYDTDNTIDRFNIDASGNVGIGTTTPGVYRLNVNGTSYFGAAITVSGDINGSGSFNYVSDQMFKTNVDTLNSALNTIKQLKPKTYYLDTLNFNEFNFSSKKQYGLIAQDVEQILPELVTSTTKPADVDTLGNVIHPAVTYKSLNYNAFTAIMLQGIKEHGSKIDSLSEGLNTEKEKTNNQDSIITSLQTQLNALASLINSCCDNNHDNGNHNGNREAIINQTNIELNDAQSIVLQQNVPNPFAEQTSINYSLPDNTLKAQMLFYNAQGKLIQSTELTQKGKGTLNVFASDLSSGIYTYTLVVDGRIIETKKMVKQ